MSGLDHQEDLDLLLSLQDRVIETPPSSPSGYLLDDEMPKEMRGPVDMSVFRDAVKDCLDYDSKNVNKSLKSKQGKSSNDIVVEKFSGIRIQNPVVSPVELSNHLSDIRFVRLPAIKTLLSGDTLSGCWATVGILTEKGLPRTSSIGKTFAIWKIGCLDDNTISLFLFGDAYEKNRDEKIGTTFALFNCSVRKDNAGKGFSLSVFASKHVLKLGTSADIGVCQGGSSGMPCTTAIDKRRRKYCSYHKKDGSKRYTSTRTELKGGNLRTGFRDYLKSEGVYMVKPMGDKTNLSKPKPQKILSVDGLKKALSTADKVTTNAYSQGIRFLNHLTVTAKMGPKATREAATLPRQQMSRPDNSFPRFRPNQEPNAKKMKMDERQQAPGQVTEKVGVKMIELDFASSDDEL
ncbi:hypothetical protein ACJIZ3_015284 [Penstemon smallii]|uniref:Zinc finger Mcm10/DnaG-type domain-containing protein n=1 Tax=Penstemon smallii TaxID=265156 RepID=A0ABD3RTA0_9LAMI